MKLGHEALLDTQMVFRRHKSRNLRRIFRKIFWTVVVLSSLVGVYTAVNRLNVFTIRQFEVVGVLKQRTVADIITGARAGLQKSLFAVSLEQVRKEILKDPWVQNATVRRLPPNSLWIHVTEYQPVALCLLDRLYFVSADGILFKPLETEEVKDLPVLTGLQKTEPEMIRQALRLIGTFESDVEGRRLGVSEVHYDAAGGFSLATLFGALYLRLGSEDFAEKLNRFRTLLAYAQKENRTLRRIDLNYEDKAYVQWKI